MNCGDARQIRPSLGSWLCYGLGSENQNLPAFVAMCPVGYPIQETQNWQSGFLPGVYQGTYIDTQHTAIEQLIEHIRNDRLSLPQQREQLDLLERLNNRHLQTRHNDPQLEARIHSFELAFRMQTEAAEAFDVRREPQHIRDMYGPGVQARQLLIARRLVERGVRFVQLWHGAGQPWDSHDDLEVNHRKLARRMRPGDRRAARRSEAARPARRHARHLGRRIRPHADGRTAEAGLQRRARSTAATTTTTASRCGWPAAASRGGYVHGATDEFGFKAVENRVHVHDLHATILHLLGFDHEKLTYRYAGRDFRLTDVEGHVVHDLIA